MDRSVGVTTFLLSAALLLSAPSSLAAQPSPVTGPVIEGYGPVYEVPDPDFTASRDRLQRVVFEGLTADEAQDRQGDRQPKHCGRDILHKVSMCYRFRQLV